MRIMSRNRAKCKLCNEVIESFVLNDYVECSCGEIAISGGSYKYLVFAKDWNNLLRVSELNEEIAVTEENKAEANAESAQEENGISLKDVLYSLESAATGIRNLPLHAQTSYVTHLDHLSLIVVAHQLFKRIIDGLEGINKLLLVGKNG